MSDKVIGLWINGSNRIIVEGKFDIEPYEEFYVEDILDDRALIGKGNLKGTFLLKTLEQRAKPKLKI